MSNIAVLTSVVILSSFGVAAATGLSSVNSVPVVASAVNSFNPSQVGDNTIDTAVEILTEARKAVKVNERRNRMKPGIQDRVVEKSKSQTDKILIMGGKEAFPM